MTQHPISFSSIWKRIHRVLHTQKTSIVMVSLISTRPLLVVSCGVSSSCILLVPPGSTTASVNSWIRFRFAIPPNILIGESDWFGLVNGTEETTIVSLPPLDQSRTGIVDISQSTTVIGTIAGASASAPTVTLTATTKGPTCNKAPDSYF